MAQVPVAPDAGALAARLDVQDANVDPVAPAPAQPAVQAPQAADAGQPVQEQGHDAQQAPEVCFLSFRCLLVSRPLFHVLCPVLVVRSVLVHSVLSGVVAIFCASRVVRSGVFVLACSFLSCYLFGLLVSAPVC